MESKVPEVIGGYELVRPLGRGGMAEVWLARKGVGDRGSKHIAIKLIAEHYLNDARYARMFRAEAELAAVLNHANIVQVFDDGEQDGRSYLVMEWVDGLNLLKLGEKLAYVHEPRRFRLISYIIGQLLHALHYAHSIRTADGHPLGVVHRDVSPQNVLVSINGEVKLTDFGVAHHNFEESSGIHVKGKVRYMAPEQISGQSRSPTVDLYAVGALLHEMLDGKKFRGEYEDGQDLFSVVLSGYVPPLSRSAPPELDVLRARLLERDPARRVQTAEEALALLERYPGYGDAREELRKLCGSATGVVHPRVGPGQSSPMNAAEQVTQPHPRRQALAKPKVEPRVPPPPPLRLRSSDAPVTGSSISAKGHGANGGSRQAWITGQTEFLPPIAPAWPGPPGYHSTERLPPSGFAGVGGTADHRPSFDDRSGSGTEQEIRSPALVDEGTATQHDRRRQTSIHTASPGLVLHRHWAVVVFGVLPVLIATVSTGVTWWIFAGERPEEVASEAMEQPRVESTPSRSLASSLLEAVEGRVDEGSGHLQTKAAVAPTDTSTVSDDVEAPVASTNSLTAPEDAGAPTAEVAPTPAPTATTNQAKLPPKKARVKIAASSGLETVEVQIGSQTFSVDGREHKIPAGSKPLKWRKARSEAWRAAGKWNFKPGKLSIIHVSKKGPSVRWAEKQQ